MMRLDACATTWQTRGRLSAALLRIALSYPLAGTPTEERRSKTLASIECDQMRGRLRRVERGSAYPRMAANDPRGPASTCRCLDHRYAGSTANWPMQRRRHGGRVRSKESGSREYKVIVATILPPHSAM